jgi:hypothetical protein
VKNFARKYTNFIKEEGQDEEFDIKRKTLPSVVVMLNSLERVESLQELINEDPGQLMRKIVEDLEIIKFFIRKIVKEDIRYKSQAFVVVNSCQR